MESGTSSEVAEGILRSTQDAERVRETDSRYPGTVAGRTPGLIGRERSKGGQ